MKKIIVLFICAVSLTLSAQAQTQARPQTPFGKHDMTISAGIGLGNSIKLGSIAIIPPIFGSFEYCIMDNLFDRYSSIGVGGVLGFARSKDVYRHYILKTNGVVIGAKGVFHYNPVKNLDTYAALTLGGCIASTRETDVTPGVNPYYPYGGFFTDFNVGARYYFTPVFAAFAEFGFGMGYFNMGVTFSL